MRETSTQRKRTGFTEFVFSDLNRDSLFSGVKAMTLFGILALSLGYALDFVLFLYSGAIFLLLALVFFSFLLRWYLRALQWDRRYLGYGRNSDTSR